MYYCLDWPKWYLLSEPWTNGSKSLPTVFVPKSLQGQSIFDMAQSYVHKKKKRQKETVDKDEEIQ